MNDANLLEDQPIAWTPTPETIERAQLTKFMRQVGVSTWDELYEFSIRDVERFTEEVLKFLDIRFDPPYEKLLDTSNGVEFPVWFSRNADTPVRNEGERNADTLVRNEGERNADALVRNEGERNADTLVRNEGEARTTASTFANKKGWHERGYLPHFDGVATQFVTFRLADSLPQNVLRRLTEELEKQNLSDNSDEYRQRVEDYLDKGIGSCILKNRAIAEIVEATLKYEHEKSCRLICWVIMPNHVHILLYPSQGHSLSEIMKRIKGVSARKINETLGTTGSVWQPDYFDRFIRDEEHFSRTVNYIANNPVKAGLCAAAEQWRFSSFSRKERNADTPVRTDAASASGERNADQAAEKRGLADKSVRVPSAGLNITEMCLDRWQTDEMKDQPAVIWEGEDGGSETLSYAELLDCVERVATNFRNIGIEKGDAVGIHLPMISETVIALLAINRIGAIGVPVFSGYGVEAIANRLDAVKAKMLVTFDGVTRRGKYIHAFDIALAAMERCSSIQYYALVRHSDTQTRLPDIGTYREFWLESKTPLDGGPEPTSAEDPLIILYTSGTTGKPKGIAHTHASFPIKAAQDMAFGTDVGRGTRISWYTDIGWMMGPWLIYGALINGATICIYDGAPDYPTPDRMWEFCANHKVEVLGISPTLVRSLAAAEERNADTPVRNEGEARRKDADKSVRVPPHARHDLSNLRIFASTGEPWNPAPWWWLFEKVGNSKLPIINYSGGTEIAGGILMGNPLLPIKPCSFPAPCPGMDVDVLDEEGNSVEPGKVGELVIKQPWIGMARGFWQEKERYLETYWRRFKDIWVHGDWAMRDKDGHWFILGRSDDTLKVAGKRVGPAEVESLLVAHPLVTEAAVIGVPDEVKGTAMVAFAVLNAECRMRNDEPSDSANSSFDIHHSSLASELRELVARDMGKPLAPSKIHFVSALPKTRNAKVMRRVIRAAYLGEDPGDLSALENPEAVQEIRAQAAK